MNLSLPEEFSGWVQEDRRMEQDGEAARGPLSGCREAGKDQFEDVKEKET